MLLRFCVNHLTGVAAMMWLLSQELMQFHQTSNSVIHPIKMVVLLGLESQLVEISNLFEHLILVYRFIFRIGKIFFYSENTEL